MSNLDLVKAALKNNMDKRVVHKPNVLAAEAKGTASKQAFEAVTGDLRGLDLDYLDSLNRIQGKLKNTYMESISANKITSGSILGTNLTLAGTEASNNKTTLTMIGDALLRVNDGTRDTMKISNTGLELRDGGESNSAAALIGRGISAIGIPNTRMWPINNANRRGWQMRSDGTAGSLPQGWTRLIATRASGNVPGDTGGWASLELNVEGSGPGVIAGYAGAIIHNMLWVVGPARIGGSLNVQDQLQVGGGATITGNVSAASGTYSGNMNVGGTYQQDGTNATFGGGIIATGTVKATGGNLNGMGLVITGVASQVVLPNLSIDASMLADLSVATRAIRNSAVTGAELAGLSVGNVHLTAGAVDRRVIDMNDLLLQLDNRYAFKSQLHYH